MKILILALSWLTILSAYGYYEGKPDLLPLEKRFSAADIRERPVSEKAQLLLGHLSLSIQSTELGLGDSALVHLQDARKAALEVFNEWKDTSKDLTGIPFGRLQDKEQGQNFYVPVLVGEGVREIYKEDSSRKEPRVEITDANIVTLSLRLNAKKTLEAIDGAIQEVRSKNYLKAKGQLNEIWANALVSESVVDEPIMIVWGNVVLAEQFLQMKQFKSARFTLGKAKENLKKLEAQKILSRDADEVKRLQKELDDLEKNLNEKSPKLLQRARNKLKEWGKKVKSWV